MPLEEWAAGVGLFIGFCLVVGIPGIAILTHHQRKMAELIHKNQQTGSQDEVLARLESMQRQLDAIQGRQNELILQQPVQTPPPLPKVEDGTQE